ncbi:hypothetical protein DEIPH_ctg062orf0002 [Deinococcus phoenicis]|uniref:DoxX family protein n=2 Tax=Deinococcus phoenicis TaxID=1476583 RepID=A0A016QM16_9DEIO|nr:hypothetical protein DEIPH_ctg062orf0002 [Deinococcus phoenicis]
MTHSWRRSIGALRIALATLHLGVAFISFHRPHLVDLVEGYAGFREIAGTTTWGAWALGIGLGLLLIPRGQPLLILWQFASAAFFLLFGILVTNGPAALNWGSGVYGLLGVWSAVLAYATADDWFRMNRWPQRFRAWLAGKWGPRGGG